MALTSTFGFTNVTDATDTLKHVQIKPVTGYSVRKDDPDQCVLLNSSTLYDQPELVTYQVGSLKRIPSLIDNTHPPKVVEGIQYGIRIDELLRVSSSTNDTYVEDLPIVMNLSIKHVRNGQITSAHIETLFKRLLGACVKADGTTRFNDLMRSAIRPSVD